ncbi:hypothetical protein [Halorubrum coriense]|uniref:hypothetical protein n=1 Tax=Halorubrum coriense TaxID=64713 RepID=UPI0012686BCE|nr:hypothetical protein [Halorubrum coriense]
MRKELTRRSVLSGITASPFVAGTPSVASTQEVSIKDGFFSELEGVSESDKKEAFIGCANALCGDVDRSEQSTEKIVNQTDDLKHHIRRVRFAVRILNEQQITSAIDESMVRSVEVDYNKVARFVPLIGSLTNLQAAACAVEDPPKPSQVERFMYACLAFGAEVALWYSTAPYRMAWSGTRFASNRSILRYANHGCNGCIAAVMSELHWGLRVIPYKVTSEDEIAFISRKLDELHAEAREIDYDVDVKLTEEEIRELVDSTDFSGGGGAPFARPPQGPIERHLPSIELPELSEILPDWLS